MAFNRRIPLLFVLLIILLFSVAARAEEEVYEPVKRAIDGETLELESGEIVRLIGVDARQRGRNDCERAQVGRARSQLEGAAAGGVRLYRKAKDAQGRTLAYAYADWRKEETVLMAPRLARNSINLYLVINGYARSDRRWAHRYSLSYHKAERWARENNVGLWNVAAVCPQIASESIRR